MVKGYVSRVRPTGAFLARRIMPGVKNTAKIIARASLRVPEELGSAVGAMMGMPMWMVSGNGGDDLGGFAPLEKDWFAQKISAATPVQKSLEAIRNRTPLDPSLQNALDEVREGRRKAFGVGKLRVKGDDLLTYFAQNTSLTQKEIDSLLKFLDKDTKVNFYRKFSLLVITHKFLRESDIEPMADKLKDEDWPVLANHLKTLSENERKNVLDYLELWGGREVVEYLKNLLEAIQEEKPTEEIKTAAKEAEKEVVIITEEDEAPKEKADEATLIQRFPLPVIKPTSEETSLEQVTKFVKLLALQETFAPPAVLEEAKDDKFKLGVLLTEAEQLLLNIDHNLGVYNKQRKAFEDLYESLSRKLEGLTEPQMRALEKKLMGATATATKVLKEIEDSLGELGGSLGDSEGIRNLRTQIKEAVASEKARAANDIGSEKERIDAIFRSQRTFLNIRSEWEATVGRLKKLIEMHESEKQYLAGLMESLREMGAEAAVSVKPKTLPEAGTDQMMMRIIEETCCGNFFPASEQKRAWWSEQFRAFGKRFADQKEDIELAISMLSAKKHSEEDLLDINIRQGSPAQLQEQLTNFDWSIDSVSTLAEVRRLREQINRIERAFPENEDLHSAMLFTRALLFERTKELRKGSENDG